MKKLFRILTAVKTRKKAQNVKCHHQNIWYDNPNPNPNIPYNPKPNEYLKTKRRTRYLPKNPVNFFFLSHDLPKNPVNFIFSKSNPNPNPNCNPNPNPNIPNIPYNPNPNCYPKMLIKYRDLPKNPVNFFFLSHDLPKNPVNFFF